MYLPTAWCGGTTPHSPLPSPQGWGWEGRASQPAPFWDRALGQWLKDGKTRVVYQVIRSRLTFIFRGAGGSGLDIRAVLGPLGVLGLGGQWRWRFEGTIESKRELVVAVEAGKYNNGKKRFKSVR